MTREAQFVESEACLEHKMKVRSREACHRVKNLAEGNAAV
jgi:hypothetical protein